MIDMHAITGSISDSGTGCAGPTTASATSRPRIGGRAAGGRRIDTAAAALAMFATLGGAVPVAGLEVDVRGLRDGHGVLRLCLTANPTKFPSCVGDVRAISRSVPAGQPLIRFDALPRGDWAVAVIHDANGNARLDTVMGIPREGFGFSNNPSIGFGAPKFAAARFRLDGDTVERIRMRYLL